MMGSRRDAVTTWTIMCIGAYLLVPNLFPNPHIHTLSFYVFAPPIFATIFFLVWSLLKAITRV